MFAKLSGAALQVSTLWMLECGENPTLLHADHREVISQTGCELKQCRKFSKLNSLVWRYSWQQPSEITLC